MNNSVMCSVRALLVALTLGVLAPTVSADPLFESDEILSITLTGAFRDMAYDRDEEPEPRPGTLQFEGADGPVTLDIEI